MDGLPDKLVDDLCDIELSFVKTITMIVNARRKRDNKSLLSKDEIGNIKLDEKGGITEKDKKKARIPEDVIDVGKSIVFDFLCFRGDGYLKTQIFTEDAFLLRNRVFLRHKLRADSKKQGRVLLEATIEEDSSFRGEELEREVISRIADNLINAWRDHKGKEPKDIDIEYIAAEVILYRHLFMITCHQDMDPDDPYSCGKNDFKSLKEQLVDKRGWKFSSFAEEIDIPIEEYERVVTEEDIKEGRIKAEVYDSIYERWVEGEVTLQKAKDDKAIIKISYLTWLSAKITKYRISKEGDVREVELKEPKTSTSVYKILVTENNSGNKNNQKAYYSFPIRKKGLVWDPKTNTWSVTARFIEKYLYSLGHDDAMILNSDRDQFFYPSTVFLGPFIRQRLVEEPRLGWLCTRMEVFVDEFMPAASDHRVSEDVWNTRTIPVEAAIGLHAFYGPGIVRWATMRDWGSYMDNIEDTGAAIEAAKLGWKGSYTPWFRWMRPREMINASIPTFQNRYGGLVSDTTMQPYFQQMLESDLIHWTEKVCLFENFDFYYNKPIIPRFNLLIFLFAMFINFTPLSYMALPLLAIVIQYNFCQAICAGGMRLFIGQPKPNIYRWVPSYLRKVVNWLVGYGLYLRRFWSLVLTFLPIIPLHDEKSRNAPEGTAGAFDSGIKDIYYPQASFAQLYTIYKPGFKWGVILSVIFLFSPLHPYGIIGQLFFYVFPVAFIFGPFFKNGYSNWRINTSIIATIALIYLSFFLPGFPVGAAFLPWLWPLFYSLIQNKGNLFKVYEYFATDRYLRGIVQGFMAFGYTAVEMIFQAVFGLLFGLPNGMIKASKALKAQSKIRQAKPATKGIKNKIKALIEQFKEDCDTFKKGYSEGYNEIVKVIFLDLITIINVKFVPN